MCYHVIPEHPHNKIYNSCTVSRCAIKLIPHSCCHREGGFMFWNISFNGLLFLFIIINHLFGDRLCIYVGICYYLCIMTIMEAAMYICLWNPQYTNLSLIYCSLGQCIYALPVYDCMFSVYMRYLYMAQCIYALPVYDCMFWSVYIQLLCI